MKIRILSIGNKLTEKDFNNYINELKKRIRPYAEIHDILLKNEEELKDFLSSYKNIFILDIDGEKLNSFQFSKLLNNDLTFVIGPHKGFDDKLKTEFKSKYRLISLSNLTLPHRLCKVILYEQIYRGFCIIKNHPYAK